MLGLSLVYPLNSDLEDRNTTQQKIKLIPPAYKEVEKIVFSITCDWLLVYCIDIAILSMLHLYNMEEIPSRNIVYFTFEL